MTDEHNQPDHTSDRPRARQHDLVMQVVIDQLASHGYQHMTIEGIAAAAGVHKATLYRWWPGKPALVAEALCAHMTVGPPPNTGTTRGDLIAWLKGTIANYTGTRAGVAMPALISDLAATPEGVTAFRQAFLTARRQGCRVLVQRGIDRGDIPAGTDIELFMDAIAGTIFYRQLVSGTPITRDLAAKIADLLLGQTAPQRRTRPTPSHPAGRHL